MSIESRVRIRILFLATVVGFAIQLVFIAVTKVEPYPALTMPSFAGHPTEEGWIERSVPFVEVEFADGSKEVAPFASVLPKTKTLKGHVLRAFGTDAFTTEPDTVNWLKSRIVEAFPGKDPIGLDVVWRIVEFNVNDQSTREVGVKNRFPVSLGGTA
jgi:hypothetical protein